MNIAFIRTTHSDDKVEFSWYDKNGRRYKHEIDTMKHGHKTVRECDDSCGYMPYAKDKGFFILDDFVGKHPKRLDIREI